MHPLDGPGYLPAVPGNRRPTSWIQPLLLLVVPPERDDMIRALFIFGAFTTALVAAEDCWRGTLFDALGDDMTDIFKGAPKGAKQLPYMDCSWPQYCCSLTKCCFLWYFWLVLAGGFMGCLLCMITCVKCCCYSNETVVTAAPPSTVLYGYSGYPADQHGRYRQVVVPPMQMQQPMQPMQQPMQPMMKQATILYT